MDGLAPRSNYSRRSGSEAARIQFHFSLKYHCEPPRRSFSFVKPLCSELFLLEVALHASLLLISLIGPRMKLLLFFLLSVRPFREEEVAASDRYRSFT